MLKIANQENIFIFLEEIRFLHTSCVLLFFIFPSTFKPASSKQ